jgi:hypothetical protein
MKKYLHAQGRYISAFPDVVHWKQMSKTLATWIAELDFAKPLPVV